MLRGRCDGRCASRRRRGGCPAIIEAWFFSSEKITEPGISRCKRRERGVVGDIGRGEQQRRFLAVQIGKLGLELDMIMGGAGDVARAAGAGADRRRSPHAWRRARPGAGSCRDSRWSTTPSRRGCLGSVNCSAAGRRRSGASDRRRRGSGLLDEGSRAAAGTSPQNSCRASCTSFRITDEPHTAKLFSVIRPSGLAHSLRS